MRERVEAQVAGLYHLREHCGYAGHPVDVCLGLPITNVFKVEVESITGKRTLPELWKQSGSGTPHFNGRRLAWTGSHRISAHTLERLL